MWKEGDLFFDQMYDKFLWKAKCDKNQNYNWIPEDVHGEEEGEQDQAGRDDLQIYIYIQCTNEMIDMICVYTCI